MPTLTQRAFWISPGGGIYEGATHVDIIAELFNTGEIDPGEYLQWDLSMEELEEFVAQLDNQDLEEIGYSLISDGWIRGFAGTKDEIGFHGTLSAFRRHEALIERLIWENQVKNIYVDIEDEKTGLESVAISSEDAAQGFVKAITRERRMARMRRRPVFNKSVQVRTYWRRRQ